MSTTDPNGDYSAAATFMLRAMPLARNDWIWVTT